MQKSPIEIVRLNPVHKEKIDSKSAKLLRSKLYQLSKESINNELPIAYKKRDCRSTQSGLNRKSIAVPPLAIVGSEGLLPLQVCNWLIYSHLLRWNYRCTIASFQSESHMCGSPEHTFTVYDILDLLGISRDSEFYTNFLAEYNEMENKGTLYTLLKHCIKHHIMKSSIDVAIQVNNVETTKSIAEKLKEIDEVFKEKQQKLQESTSESHINKMKNTIESNEMLEIERKIEIENIKKREKIIYEKELENAKSRIKQEFEARLEILQQKQMEYQNEMLKKRELEQQEINRLKEQLVQELDNLQKYEETIKHELEQKRTQFDMEAKILLEKTNNLKMKEYEIEKQKIQATALNEEISDSLHKSSALQIEQKLAELRIWEEKLRNEAERLQEERHQASKKADEVIDLKPKLHELEITLGSLQDKYSEIVKQNRRLSNKLDSMADYSSVKAELCYTKKELETVKQHLAETRKEALYAAKSNIQHLREQRSPEGRVTYYLPSVGTSYQVLLQEQCKRLEKEIEELRHLNMKVTARNDQQQQEIEDLKRTVQSFEMHLHYSQNKFSDLPIKEDRSSLLIQPLSNPNQVPVSLLETRTADSIHSFNPSTSKKHTLSSFSPSSPYSIKRSHSFDKEKHLKFLTEARKRIDYLQVEAEASEKRYGDYLKSQANMLWSIPTSVNTLFSGTEHPSFSQNIFEIDKTYNPYSTIHSFKSKFSTHHSHSFPHSLKDLKTTIPNYPTINSISIPLGGTKHHFAEGTHISIQTESSQSESNTVPKNKLVSDIQLPYKTETEKAQIDESFKAIHKSSSEAKETSERKENVFSMNSKEFPIYETKTQAMEISDNKSNPNDTDLKQSNGNSKSINISDGSKLEAGDFSKTIKIINREENNDLVEAENVSSHHISPPNEITDHSEVQDKLLLDKVEENIGLFHRDNSLEKHLLKQDVENVSLSEKHSSKRDTEKDVSLSEKCSLKRDIDHSEKDVTLSEKCSINRNDIEENILSELHNNNVLILPSVVNAQETQEKAQETPDKDVLQENGIGDAFDVNIHKEIEQATISNKIVLPENDHSVSSRKSEIENSSSHKTDAPEISEISISAGSVGHVSKGDAESDFW